MATQPHAAPLLEIEGVSKWFDLVNPDGHEERLIAVDRVDQSVREGAFITIVGPSGCGKSTLLEMVAGLKPLSAGEIRLRGRKVTGPDSKLAMVFQEESTYPWRSVMGNVEFGLEIAGVQAAERRSRCQSAIELVGLAGFERAMPRQLSGGMRQRVAIARALAYDPDILLMDEPFGALDQQTRTFLGEELLRLWSKTKKTIVFVTHDIHEAVMLSTEVWVMSYRPGRIREVVPIDLPRGSSAELMSNPRFSELTGQIWSYIKEEWDNNYLLKASVRA